MGINLVIAIAVVVVVAVVAIVGSGVVDRCGGIAKWMEVVGGGEGVVGIDIDAFVCIDVIVVVVVFSVTGKVSIVWGPIRPRCICPLCCLRQGFFLLLLLLLLVLGVDMRLHLQPFVRFGCGLTTAWLYWPKGQKKKGNGWSDVV